MALGLWDNWMLMALAAPAAWALTSIIDVCFVSDRILEEPADGAIISCLFCGLALFVLFTDIGGWDDVTLRTSAPALLAGACFYLHIHFYFKALFVLNDASNAEIFNTLSVLIVPVLAFLLLGERLAPIYYIAIGLAMIGILVLIRSHGSGTSHKAMAFLIISATFISLVMVLQAWVFEHMNYWNGVVLFSSSSFVTAAVVMGIKRGRGRRIARLCWRFGPILFVAEALQSTAVLLSQRATHVGPSVSLVAVVECTLPLFVMVFSLGAIGLSRYWRGMSQDMHDALVLQTDAFPAKLMAITLIGTAMALLPAG